jgi:hypothetical protein
VAIIAKGNILHNGKNYKKGDEINDLKEDEAQRLLDLEVVEDDGSKAKSPKADKE